MPLYIIVLFTWLMSSSGMQSIDESMETELDELFSAKFQSGEPGGSILIKKGSETIYMNSYGIADLTTGTPITEHTIFNTGSISKTFVANGILMLSE